MPTAETQHLREAIAAAKAKLADVTLAIQAAAIAGYWLIADDIARREGLPYACRRCGKTVTSAATRRLARGEVFWCRPTINGRRMPICRACVPYVPMQNHT